MSNGVFPACVASILVLACGCAADTDRPAPISGATAPRPADAPPAPARVMVASASGVGEAQARAAAERAVVAQLRAIVGTPPESTAAYAGTMRREGFDTHLSSELFSMDRFEQSAQRVGLTSRGLAPTRGAAPFRAEARLDTDALLLAYQQEIANAERVLAWMASEQGRWSAESWAGVEALKANVRAGRDWLIEARDRVKAWRGGPE